MSNTERLMKQGLLAEKRDELKRIEDLAHGAIDTIRIQTFVQTTVFDLDVDSVSTHAHELERHVKNGLALRQQITKLEEELGQR